MNDTRNTENLTIHHRVKDYAAWRKGPKIPMMS